ncbi:MAG TPA: universal stress protein [Chthoniobacterales bacterium]
MKTATLPAAGRHSRISCRFRPTTQQPPNARIKNVLVPIDFSERSLEALELAQTLTKQFGAELHLAHIYERDFPLTTVMAMPLALPPVQVGQGVRRHLKEVAKKRGLDMRPGNYHAIEGRPADEVCELARQHSMDLIVVSTRGNTGLKHLVLGSTAERIVRYSPCPVLVVHPQNRNGKSGKRGVTFDKILVPIDFSACSLKGLEFAKGLAGKFGSKLVLLNSVAFQYYITSDEYARYDLPLLMQQAEKASRTQMRELIQNTDWEGIEVRPSLRIGHAGQQICVQAAEDDVDLIVTSTHGTTGFKHILVGSTAEYVVRHAGRPVLVVPSHDRPRLGGGESYESS